MDKSYIRINWENYPSDSTPLNEDNLNKIDRALDEVDNRVITLDATKLGLNVANNMITGFSLDPNTGVITITKYDGSTQTFDTALEKVAINFEYDEETERLVITLDDGSKQYVDLSSLVDNYTFSKSPSALLMLSIPIRQLEPILAFWSMMALLMIVALPIPMFGMPFFALAAFSSSLSYLEAPMQ